MEQLAERRMQREEESQFAATTHPNPDSYYSRGHGHGPPEDDEDDDEYDEDYDSQEDEYEEEEDMVLFVVGLSRVMLTVVARTP